MDSLEVCRVVYRIVLRVTISFTRFGRCVGSISEKKYFAFQELAQASTTLPPGRAALQKKIMGLLRKIDSCNQVINLGTSR